MKLLAKNRRANFDYAIDKQLIAGLQLNGDEVKSIKNGHVSLKGSFVILRENEAYLTAAHVTPYSHAYRPGAADPTRQRKLLLHRRQLNEMVTERQAGNALVPLALVEEHGFIKLEIGIGRGKKNYDKRASLKERDMEREVARTVIR